MTTRLILDNCNPCTTILEVSVLYNLYSDMEYLINYWKRITYNRIPHYTKRTTNHSLTVPSYSMTMGGMECTN